MKSRRNLLCALLAGLAALLTFACSSGGGGNSLFLGAGAAQGTFFGTSGGTGTSSGGTSETWNVNIDHVNNAFSAQNVTAGKNYSGTISTPPSLFTENVTTTSNDGTLTLPATGHSIEVTDALVVLHLDDNAQDVTPLINTKGQCPTLSGPTTFNAIRYGWKNGWDSTTQNAYDVITVTQSGSTFTVPPSTNFKLDGTPNGSGSGGSQTCSNGVFTPVNSNDSPVAFSPTELIAISGPSASPSGSDHSEFVFPDPATPSIASIVAGQYTGMVFNQTFAKTKPAKVGFGPGAGSSISGGTFANIKTDAFSAHANNITITLAAGPSAGLLTGSVTDVNGVHSPMIVMVMTAKNGKFQIVLLTTDTSFTEPYHIFLSQK